MLSTNFALRPIIREDEDESEAWEVLKVVIDEPGTVVTKRVGFVNVPNMGYTPLTLLQFVLSCYKDQNPQGSEDAVFEEKRRNDDSDAIDVDWNEV